MATNIIICAVGYLILSSLLLIALLRAAARTSADWTAYAASRQRTMAEAYPTVHRARAQGVRVDARPRADTDAVLSAGHVPH